MIDCAQANIIVHDDEDLPRNITLLYNSKVIVRRYYFLKLFYIYETKNLRKVVVFLNMKIS